MTGQDRTIRLYRNKQEKHLSNLQRSFNVPLLLHYFCSYREALTCHCRFTISAPQIYSWINLFIFKVSFCPLLATTTCGLSSFGPLMSILHLVSGLLCLYGQHLGGCSIKHTIAAFSNTWTIRLFHLKIWTIQLSKSSSGTHATRASPSRNFMSLLSMKMFTRFLLLFVPSASLKCCISKIFPFNKADDQ